MAKCNCPLLCTKTIPRPITDCIPKHRAGGISNLVFASCNVKFKDINNVNEWCDYVRDGKIKVSPKLIADMPKPSFNKKRVESCNSEIVTGADNTINFRDFNADNTNFTDFDYWNYIIQNKAGLQFGWVTCDGDFFGFIKPFTIQLDFVVEQTSSDTSQWDGQIMWRGINIPKPLRIPNFCSILNGDCGFVLNHDECPQYDENDFKFPLGKQICGANGIIVQAPILANATYDWFILGGNYEMINEYTYRFYELSGTQVTIKKPGCTDLVIDPFASGNFLDNTPTLNVNAIVAETSQASPNYGQISIFTGGPNPPSIPVYGWKLSNDPTPIEYIWNSNVFTGAEDGETYVIGVKDNATGCVKEVQFTFTATP